MICSQDEILRYLGKAGGAATADDLALAADVWPAAERLLKKYLQAPIEQATFTDILPPWTRQDDPDAEFVQYDIQGNRAIGYLPWDVQQVLQLQHTPVRSVQAVYETWIAGGGLNVTPDMLVDPGQYFLDVQKPGISYTGLLIKPYSIWPRMGRSIQVQYTAGYSAAELDPLQLNMVPEFKLAVKMQASKMFRTAQAMWNQQMGFGGVGPISSEGLDGVSYSYDAAAVRNITGQATQLTPEVREILQEHRDYARLAGIG